MPLRSTFIFCSTMATTVGDLIKIYLNHTKLKKDGCTFCRICPTLEQCQPQGWFPVPRYTELQAPTAKSLLAYFSSNKHNNITQQLTNILIHSDILSRFFTLLSRRQEQQQKSKAIKDSTTSIVQVKHVAPSGEYTANL